MANRVIYSKAYDSKVEYLESTGTQYIDSGINAENGLNILCDFMPIDNKQCRPCAASAGAPPRLGILLQTNTGKIINQYETINNILSDVVDNNTRHTIANDNGSLYYDGVLIDSTNSRTFNIRKNLFIFASNSSSIITSYVRIYRLRISNSSTSNVLADFIPVRKGNTGYMYDKVSGQLFGNQGTGNFIIGPDVANPVPNIRRVFRFGNKRFVMPMSYDSRVEYLESNGTQWIDTDTIVNSLDSISVTLQFTKSKAPACIWNARNVNPIENTISLFRMVNNSLRFDYGKTQVSKNASGVNFSIKHEYKSVANTLYVDGISKGTNTASSFTAGKSVKVLASSNSNNASIITNFAYAKLYSVKIKNSNNEILRDLIPVRKNGIGYMYDRVSGRLFGNAGTRQFILGNDIND